MIIYAHDPLGAAPEHVFLVPNDEENIFTESVRRSFEQAQSATVLTDQYTNNDMRHALVRDALFLVDSSAVISRHSRTTVRNTSDRVNGMERGALAQYRIEQNQVSFTQTPITHVYRLRRPL